MLAMVGGASIGFAVIHITLFLLAPFSLPRVAEAMVTTAVTVTVCALLGWRFWGRLARMAIRLHRVDASAASSPDAGR
jgi:hypothetical protein